MYIGGGNKMKYKVILFDADETLFDFNKSEANAFEKTINNFNMEYDSEYHYKIYKEINKGIWSEFEKGLIDAKDLKIERFKRLSEGLGVSFDPKEFSDVYLEFLSQESNLFDEAYDLIYSLSKNYKLGIITNGLAKVQNNRFKKSPISKYFDSIIISEEVNVSKPNPKIFEYSLDSLKHEDKNSVLIVGDSLTSDIKGGLNFGIDTCWYNPYKIENTSEIVPKYEINNLAELKNIL